MLGLRTVTTGRLRAGCVALVLTLTAAASLAPVATPLFAASRSPQLTLNLNLATSQELSAVSIGSLVAEVNAIWWHSNLSVIWRTADVSDPLPAMPESEDWLRVLVLARQPASSEIPTFTVGELVRYEGSRPLAVASLTGARRVVDESARLHTLEGPRDYDRRLGVVLGRAVAHEIGHYLLGSGTHSSHGLMRATIDAQEFADVRSRAFMLDDAAQAHLTQLAAARLRSTSVIANATR